MVLVSIIMPCHNSQRYIEDAIRSVQEQTFTDWELIVADDGSTDESSSIVEKLARSDPRIKFLASQGERTGPAKTRNRAINLSVGRFVAFLDSDDCWAQDKLRQQLQLHEDRGCKISFTALVKMDAAGNFAAGITFGGERISYKQLLRRNYIPCSSVVVDRSKTGPFLMPEIYRRQDYALWLMLLRRGGEALGINEPLLHYRVYPDSFSASKLVGALYHWKVLRQFERIHLIPCIFLFANYAYGSGLEYLKGRFALSSSGRI